MKRACASQYGPSRRARFKSWRSKERVMPLHYAICNKLSTELRCLIEEGCDVNGRDQYKRTALMLCCIENDEKWSAGVVMMLLQAGANAALCDVNGRNALMFAVIFTRRKITDLLLNAIDFSIHKSDSDNKTALHYAVMQGDQNIIRRVSSAFNSESRIAVIDSSGCSDSDSCKLSGLRPRTKSLDFCKSLMQSERSKNHIHRSSSEMNVHQFRRQTMRKFWLRSRMREKFVNVEISLPQPSSMTSSSCRNRHPMPSVSSFSREHFATTVEDFSELDTHIDLTCSWKASVPAFWHILASQCSESYRTSAKVTFQTLEEALGLPPKEQDDGEVLPDVETSSNTSSGNSPPRRSSMPVTSNQQAVTTSRAERRRSEASIGLLLHSGSRQAASEQKVFKRQDTLGELRRAKEALDSKVDIRITNKSDRANKEDIGNVEPGILSPTKSRTEGVALKKTSRTPITRNRPGSALRQQLPLSSRTSQMDPKPVIDDQTDQVHITTVLSNTNKLDAAASSALHSKPGSVSAEVFGSQNVSENLIQVDDSLTKSSEEKQQTLPRRTTRRGSILLRERILSDIIEENEISQAENVIASTGLRSRTTRCTSAFVRGKTASGRRNTR